MNLLHRVRMGTLVLGFVMCVSFKAAWVEAPGGIAMGSKGVWWRWGLGRLPVVLESSWKMLVAGSALRGLGSAGLGASDGLTGVDLAGLDNPVVRPLFAMIHL